MIESGVASLPFFLAAGGGGLSTILTVGAYLFINLFFGLDGVWNCCCCSASSSTA